MAMDEHGLEIERLDTTVTFRLARPRVRNAVDNATLQQLGRALDEALASGARALIIEGAAGTFCSGSDLKALAANDEAYRREHTRLGQAVFSAIERAPVLSIALVEGYCLGGGFELALACDLRFAVAGSTWGFPEVTIGGIPAWGGTQRLPRYVGLARAKQLLLTGQRLKAEELASWGVLNGVFPDRESAVTAAIALGEKAATAPASAFALIKQLTLASFDLSLPMGNWAEALAEDAIGSEFEKRNRDRNPGEEGTR
jgi:enoyl-CoA hydratase/carnithine racemase